MISRWMRSNTGRASGPPAWRDARPLSPLPSLGPADPSAGAHRGVCRDDGAEGRPDPGSRLNVEPAPDGVETVFHVGDTGAARGGRDVEPTPIVDDLDLELVAVVAQANLDARRRRVLLNVLQRLERAEVEGGLSLLRVPPDAVGIDMDRSCRLGGLRAQRLCQTFVGKQGRVDAAGEIAKGVERFVGIAFELAENCRSLGGISDGKHLDDAQLDLEGDQVLLGAVVEVAFKPASLAVRGADQALSRGAKLVDPSLQCRREPDVLQDQAGLVGEVVHQLDLDRCERLTTSPGHRERPEALPP